MKISVASIALPIVLGAIALMQPARVEAQSMYSLFTDNIMISPANGQTALSSYLLRFGIFINNFTPTLANFSQWDANFMGSTGALGERVSRYGGQFSASNNSLYPAGSQLYMVAYNVAPDASVSTATHGVLLTHSNWILSGPSRVFRNGRAVGWTWYYYDVNGAWTAAGDMSESNIAGITSTSAFSSPFNTLSLGPSVAAGGGAGQVLQISFDMVPEPSAVSLLAIGFGGWIVLRRVRRRTD